MSTDSFVIPAMITGQLQAPTVVKYPSGDHWLVYLDQNRQLALRPLIDDEDPLVREDILPVENGSDWVAGIDEKGVLHGISTGKHNLHYWYGQPGGAWDDHVLSTLNGNQSEESIPLFLGCRLSTLQLIYLNRNPLATDWSLYHCKWSSKQQAWSSPTCLAQAGRPGKERPPSFWAVDMDLNGMIHLVYLQPDHTGSRLYHRNLTPGGSAGKTLLITGTVSIKTPPDMVVDIKGNVHLVWIDATTCDLKYRLYKQGGWPGGGWLPERSIIPWAEDYSYPLLQVQEQMVVIAWQQANQVYGCLSQDLGSNWEATLPLTGLPKTLPVRYAVIPSPGEMTARWSFCTEQPPIKLATPILFLLPSLLQPAQPMTTPVPEPQPSQPPQPLQPPQESQPATPGVGQQNSEGDLSFFIEQHNDYFQRMIQQAEDLKQVNAQITASHEETTRELIAATNHSRQVEARARSMSQQLLTQNENIKLMESNIQRLTVERSRLVAENQKLNQQAETLRAELQTHLTSQKDADAEFVEQKRVLQERVNELAGCRQSLYEEEQKNAILASRLTEREQAIASLEQQLTGLQELYQQAQQKATEKKPGILERLSRVIQ